MAKFQIWTYEVWGNPKDGFEVNNRFLTNEEGIELKESWSDKRVFQELKKAGILKKGVHFDSLDIDGEFDYTMYVNQVNQAVGGYYPICELENLEN